MCCVPISYLLGISLSTAAVVIGWISTLICLFKSTMCIGILIFLDKIMYLIGDEYAKNAEQSEIFETAICVGASVLLAISLLDLFASILLIMGAKKNSPTMLLPWIVNNIILLFISVPFNLMLISNLSSEINVPTGVSILLIVGLVLHWLAWTEICSLYQSLRKSREHL